MFKFKLDWARKKFLRDLRRLLRGKDRSRQPRRCKFEGLEARKLLTSVTIGCPTVSGNSSPLFVVSLVPAPSNLLNINYTVQDLTAGAGVDHAPKTGSLTFTPQSATQGVILHDIYPNLWGRNHGDHARDTISLSLHLPAGVAGNTSAINTIAENGDPPTLNINGPGCVTEGEWASFSVTVTGITASTTVGYQAWNSDGGTTTNGSLTFDVTNSVRTITVSAFDDHLWDRQGQTGSIGLTISPHSGVYGTDSTTATIAEDGDDRPTLSVSGPDTATEGDVATFTATLSNGSPPESSLAVGYTVLNGDGPSTTGTVVIGAGSRLATFTVNAFDDGRWAPQGESESIYVSLGSSPAATGQTSWNTVIIEDSSDTPTLSFSGSDTVLEGSSATFTAVLSGDPPESPVTVGYTVWNGDAPTTTGSVTFSSGSTEATFSVVASDDGRWAQGNEDASDSISVSLSLPAGVAGNPTYTTLIEEDSSDVPTLDLGGPSAVLEGHLATFTVTLSGDQPENALTVGYTVWNGDAPSTTGNVYFGTGNTTATIAVTAFDDGRWAQGGEDTTDRISVVLSPSAATAGRMTYNTLITEDSDDMPSLSVSGPASVAEGTAATFTATLSRGDPPESALTVGYTVCNGDGPTTTGTVTFDSGCTTATFSVTAYDDERWAQGSEDNNEKISVSMNVSAAGLSGSAAATTTITEDGDDKPTLTISGPSTVAEGGMATFTVSVASGDRPESAMTVSVSCSSGDDDDSDDFSLSTGGQAFTGTAVIPAGGRTAEIVMQTLEDYETDAHNEDVTLTLLPNDPGYPGGSGGSSVSSGSGYSVGESSSVTVTITDDQEVTITATNAYARETPGTAANPQDIGEFTISRGEGNTDGDLKVYYQIDTSNLPTNVVAARDGIDYVAIDPNGAYVIIPDGYSSTTIKIQPINNGTVDWDKVVQLTLTDTDSTKYVVDPGHNDTDSVTIFDNDQIGGMASANADATSTGQRQQTVGNGTVNVGLQTGEATLSGVVQFDQFSPIYEGNDNIQPIISVETQFPGSTKPDSITAVLHFGANKPSSVNFSVPSQITSASQPMRFVILGPASLDQVLASGHYDWDIQFTVHLGGIIKTRTIRGSTDLLNRVNPDFGETMFGQRWWIPGLDELVPADGEGAQNSSTSQRDPTNLVDEGLAARPGVDLVRGDGTAAWYASTIDTGSTPTIVDTASPNFSKTGNWKDGTGGESPSAGASTTDGAGYSGYLSATCNNDGTSNTVSATWSFPGLPGGRLFQVLITWVPDLDAVSPTYEVSGGTPLFGTQTSTTVDQGYGPGDVTVDGTQWRSLGWFIVGDSNSGSGTLTVTLDTISVGEGECASADAVMLASGWTFTPPDGSFGTTLTYDRDPPNESSDTFTLTDKYGGKEKFDVHGHLIQEFDRNGNQTKFSWDSTDSKGNKQLTSIEVQGGQTWTYNYPTGGDYLTSTTDFANRQVNYTDPSGQVTEVDWPVPSDTSSDAQAKFKFQYDADGRLTSVTRNSAGGDETGYSSGGDEKTLIAYDTITSRVSSVTNPDNHQWQLSPLLADGLESQDESSPEIRKPASGAIGDKESSSPGDTFVEPRATYTDPAGNDWVYQTDAYGYVTAEAKPATSQGLGEDVWTWQRDDNGLVDMYTQPAGGGGYEESLGELTTTYSYDYKGNCTEAVYLQPGVDSDYPDGISESWIYDQSKFNQMTSHTDPLGYETTYSLDSHGNVQEEDDPPTSAGTRRTTYTYTSAPAATAITAMPGGLVHVETAAAETSQPTTMTTAYYTSGAKTGLVESVTVAKGGDSCTLSTYDYDSYRNPSTSTDQYGSVSQYHYDKLNRLISQSDPDPNSGQAGGPTTHYHYDAAGNQVAVIDPLQHETDSEYDLMNRVLQVTAPAPNGAAAEEIAWLQLSVPSALADDETATEITKYEYDADGNQTSLTDPEKRLTTYKYDERNQCYETDQPAPNESGAPSGMSSGELSAPKTQYTFDTLGELATMTDPGGAVTDYAYDELQRETKVLAPPPNNETSGQTETDYKYDDDGNLTEVDAPGASGTAVTKYKFDELGRKIEEDDPATSAGTPTTKYQYDDLDQVVQTTAPSGAVTATTYDAQGRPTEVDASHGSGGSGPPLATSYDYSSDGTHTTITATGSSQSRVTVDYYDADGRLTEEDADANGSPGAQDEITKFQYDADGNQTEVSRKIGSNAWATTDTSYNAEGQPWQVLGPAVDNTRPQSITLYDLDGESCETQVENLNAQGNPYWAVTDTTYDADGNAYETQAPTGASGRPTSFSFYNNQGELRFSQGPQDVAAGRYTQYQYDALGEQIDATGPTGVDTQTSYDDAGNAVQSRVVGVLPGGANATTTTTYDNDGCVTSVEGPDGETTRYGYDVQGDVLTESLGSGGTTETTTNTYDSFGNKTSTTDPANDQTDYTVDAFGEVTGQQEGADDSTTVYNALGQVYSTTDGDGNTMYYSYDALGRCTSTTDANGQATTYGYDAEGNQTSVTDPDGNTTTYSYDLEGNKTAETVTDSSNVTLSSQSWTYDGDGNCLSHTDADGRTTTYTYDLNGRVTGEYWYSAPSQGNPSGTLTNSVSYGYDALGELTSEGDNYSAYTYQYDALGRQTAVASANPGQPTVVLTSGYDAAATALGDDMRTSLSANIGGTLHVDGSVSGGTLDFRNTYSYNTQGLLTVLGQQGQTGGNGVAQKAVNFGYEGDHRVNCVNRYQVDGNGTHLVAASGFTYDNRGDLTDLIHTFTDSSNNTTGLGAYHWTYDDAGRVMHQDSAADALTTSGPGTVDYSYDDDGQLTDATYGNFKNGPGNEHYTFDPVNGNETDNNQQIGVENQLQSEGAYSYAYDAAGNLLTRTKSDGSVASYTWDNRNRLTDVQFYDSSANLTMAVHYTYDVENRWIGETVTTYSTPGDLGTGTVASQRQFVYDGNQIVLSFGGSTSSSLTNRYLWGPAVDQLLAQEAPGALQGGLLQPGAVDWALTDNLGSVRDLAVYDDATGTSIGMHAVYSSFGNRVSQVNPMGGSAVDCLFGFTARPYDPATKLQNNGNRWYEPITHRWLSQDPAAADENLYRYCGNGPTDGTDPSGLNWFSSAMSTAWDGITGTAGKVKAGVIRADQFVGQVNAAFWTGDWVASETASGVGAALEIKAAVDRAGQNGVIAVGKGVREVGYMGADLTNAYIETKTGYQLYSGDMSQALQAINSGQLSYRQYYGEFTANTLTVGTYGEVKAGYQWATGQISADQASETIVSTALMQGVGAKVMQTQGVGTTPIRLSNVTSTIKQAAVRLWNEDSGAMRIPGLGDAAPSEIGAARNLARYRDIEYVGDVMARASQRSVNRALSEGLSGRAAGARAEAVFEQYGYQMQLRLMAADSPYRITLQPAADALMGTRVIARTQSSFAGRWTAGAKRLDYGFYSVFQGRANTAPIITGGDFTVTPNGALGIPGEYSKAFPGATIYGIDPANIAR